MLQNNQGKEPCPSVQLRLIQNALVTKEKNMYPKLPNMAER